MEDCPYTGCAQNKERKQNSANTPLQWLDWPQTTAKIVIQSVSDTAEKKTFSGRENRAWPAWSLVTRWTEPARSWGCASSKSDVYRSGDGSSRTSNGSNRRLLVLPTKYIAGAKDKGLRLEPETGTKPFGRPDHVTSRVRMGDERSHLISRQPGIPRFLPLNVHLGETLDGKTGRPRRFEKTQARSPRAGLNRDAGLRSLPSPHSARPSRRRRLSRMLKATAALGMVAGMLAVGWFAFYVAAIHEDLPSLPARPAATLSEASLILAADGTELGTLFGERRTWVSLEDISPIALKALVATEDHRYFDHKGVDWVRMAGAFWSTAWGNPEGASTIPMQLARNYYPELQRKNLLDRKLSEILLARRISREMSKDQVLEWYINTVPFGQNSFGIEAAAQRFYSVSSGDLTLHQAALLVGILKGTTRYNPLRNPEMSRSRRDVVLDRMAALEIITLQEATAAKERNLELNPHFYDPADSPAPYFLDYVRKEAEAWARRAGYNLKSDGLVVHTSLRPELQKHAKQAVDQQSAILQRMLTQEFGAPGSVRNERYWREQRALEEDLVRRTEVYRTLRASGSSDYDALLAVRGDTELVQQLRQQATQLQASLVVMEPGSGQILAWVGGHDYNKDQFDKVAAARRQPGSIFKPILYARALEDGYSPYYMVEDEIRTFVTNTRGEQWTPTNSGGGASGRLVTLEQGLAWSKNTVSAHLINKIGPQDVIDLAQDMGVSSPMMPVPSLALGTSETSLLEMVNAYATIADYGVRRNVTAITSISDKEGHIVATFPSEPDRVLSEQTSYTMINMLRKAVDQGTGGWLRTRFGIQGDVAGKTGTTQNNADDWFVAMHPDAVVGAWVGFNDQRVTFTSDYWGQGGHNALLLVGDFLQSGSKGPAAYISSSEFKRPAAYQNPKKPLYTAPPKHIDLAAIGGELREPFEDESFTAPARSPQSISTFTRRARIRTLSTPPDRGQ